jgi:hypothetical protein
MNFGLPRMEIRQPSVSEARSARVRELFARRAVFLHGTHWLVIHPRGWRLQTATGLSVRDTDSAKRLNVAVAQLDGEMLDGVAIHPLTGRTEFFFDLGGRITVRWPRTIPAQGEAELWSLHGGSRFLAVFAGGRYDTGALTRASIDPRPIGTSQWLVVARSVKQERRIHRELSAAVG